LKQFCKSLYVVSESEAHHGMNYRPLTFTTWSNSSVSRIHLKLLKYSAHLQ